MTCVTTNISDIKGTGDFMKPVRKYTILILREPDKKSKSFGIYENSKVSRLPLQRLAKRIEELLKSEDDGN